MSVIGHSPLAGASGAAGGADPLYVDDVFSTFLYTATSATTQTITNGIDLDGEGGMVWIKNRANGGSHTNHAIVDSERIGTHGHNAVWPNLAEAEWNPSTASDVVVTSLNSDGFTRGGNHNVDITSATYASWTFRKAPGFFDVVTYTGTGSAQNISHSLGSTPGMIMVKRLSGSSDWSVWHRSLSVPQRSQLRLNTTGAEITTNTDYWGNTAPTSTQFTVGNSQLTGGNNETYVAYLFAHDDQSFGTDEDEAIIKCGSYTGNGSSSGPVIDLGFEPQWLLIKSATGSNADGIGWYLFDNMRGIGAPGVNDKTLSPNTTGAESTGSRVGINSTGFSLTTSSGIVNGSSTGYIYMAIRRPNKPPTAGTDVFKMQATSSSNTSLTSLNPYSDLVLTRKLVSSNTIYNSAFVDRLRGNKQILTSSQDRAETNFSGTDPDLELVGLEYPVQRIDSESMVFHSFKRAPGFFDMVAYTGNGGSLTVNHNLTVIPEISIIKSRSATGLWAIEVRTDSFNARGRIDSTSAVSNSNLLTSVTATSFALPSFYNTSGRTYIVYLFASLDGISKIGTYSGTGSNVNVDCGFTAGARFVLIKRTDSTGTDWYVWDTTRGIVSGNDPYFLLNSTAAQVTSTDYIDPLNAGFTVTSSAPAALNTSGGTYLFLAIA